jgi:hypothetical protein
LHRPAVGGDHRQRYQGDALVFKHGRQGCEAHLAVFIVGDDPDLDPAPLPQLQVWDVVAGVFGHGGQHGVAGLERQ